MASKRIIDKTKNQRGIPEVHMIIPENELNPRNSSHQAFPLLEANMPNVDLRNVTINEQRVQSIYTVIDWLNVEDSNRYVPQTGKTYCNVYIYDLVFCLGGYVPRVWWHEDTITKYKNGEKIRMEYGKTLFEQTCNEMFDWFQKYGFLFSWKQISNVSELNRIVNEKATIGVIIAKRKDVRQSGHITAVIPINELLQPPDDILNLKTSPLQSQAGVKNVKYFAVDWWSENKEFDGVNFWYWDI